GENKRERNHSSGSLPLGAAAPGRLRERRGGGPFPPLPPRSLSNRPSLAKPAREEARMPGTAPGGGPRCPVACPLPQPTTADRGRGQPCRPASGFFSSPPTVPVRTPAEPDRESAFFSTV